VPTPVVSRIPIDPVSFETLEWKPRSRGIYSRAEVERQTGSYRAIVPARISQWVPLMSAQDSADIEDATRQMVEFDLHAKKALGTAEPSHGPMAAILLRTESASSSQIEQLTTSAKQLALAEIDQGERSNARTVIGNVRAMEAALRLSERISEESIHAMHAELMLNQSGFDPGEAGLFRSEQVWIGPGEAGPRTAHFVAPHHEHIPSAMEDLVTFITRADLPVLLHAAVAHAQCETIHPFSDGNGRTGRALVHSILKNKGLMRATALPISAGLLTDLDTYFSALSDFQRGDAGPIVRRFAHAARVAAMTGTQLVDDLVEVLESSRQKMTSVRSDAAAWKVLPALVGQPAVSVDYLKNKLGLGEMAALRALNVLTERGVLTEITGKKRGRAWEHDGILEVLDSYAEQIRRMSTHQG